MQRHKLVSWSHIDIKPYPNWLMNFGNVHIPKPRPLCPLPFFLFYTTSRSHGVQMDPSYMRQGLDALFTASLEKGVGGWFVFWLLVEDDFRSTQR